MENFSECILLFRYVRQKCYLNTIMAEAYAALPFSLQ